MICTDDYSKWKKSLKISLNILPILTKSSKYETIFIHQVENFRKNKNYIEWSITRLSSNFQNINPPSEGVYSKIGRYNLRDF